MWLGLVWVEGLHGQFPAEGGQLPWVRLLVSSSGAVSVGSRALGRGPPEASRERGQGLAARGWNSDRDSSGPNL